MSEKTAARAETARQSLVNVNEKNNEHSVTSMLPICPRAWSTLQVDLYRYVKIIILAFTHGFPLILLSIVK